MSFAIHAIVKRDSVLQSVSPSTRDHGNGLDAATSRTVNKRPRRPEIEYLEVPGETVTRHARGTAVLQRTSTMVTAA